jgi:alcohol dehydrogenase, propanol-preferring
MSAYRLLAPGRAPEWCEVDIPVPRPGEVLVRMGGAGLCRTDLEIVDEHRCVLPFRAPFTLGHENAGWVESVGAGVTDLVHGEPVVVSTIKSCGHCRACVRGLDNFCATMSSRGLCEDGGIAPFMIADRRQLVPLGNLHPVQAAPLADAGLTAFAAANALVIDDDAQLAWRHDRRSSPCRAACAGGTGVARRDDLSAPGGRTSLCGPQVRAARWTRSLDVL